MTLLYNIQYNVIKLNPNRNCIYTSAIGVSINNKKEMSSSTSATTDASASSTASSSDAADTITKFSNKTNIMVEGDVFIKKGVSKKEYEIHKEMYEAGIKTCRIISYDEAEGILTMEKLDGMSLSDMYGESYKKLPKSVKMNHRVIIKSQYEKGIVYVDNTGYNVVEVSSGDLYQIDYGHAKRKGEETEEERNYVLRYINGKEGWNPDYR